MKIEKRRGGWFVVPTKFASSCFHERKDWSGPWNTKQAAELASVGKYREAHDAEKEPKS